MTAITLEVDLFSLVFLLGAVQGMFLVLALLTIKKGAHQANRFLALFTLTFSITLVDVFMLYTHYYAQVPWLVGVIWTTNYLYGPLLLFYTHSLVKKGWTLSRQRAVLHFLPFFLAWFVMLPIFTLSGEVKTELLFGDGARLFEASTEMVKLHLVFADIVVKFLAITTIVQIGLYLSIVLKNLREHGRRLTNEFSYTENINLNWLRYITYALLVLWVMFTFTELLAEQLEIEEQSIYALHVMIAILIYTMSYFGLQQPEIFKQAVTLSPGNDEDTNSSASDPVTKKYGRSSLSRDQVAQLASHLQKEMNENQLHLDSQLTLLQLASAIETTPHHLSQVINGHFRKNFFEFVNEYRVREAKRRIGKVDKGRLNVYAIALDSGFSSKSAFYTSFKGNTGMTPSEYKQKLITEMNN